VFYCIKTNTFFRSDKDSSPNHASGILEGLFFADSVVPEIGVRKAELTREAAGLNEELSNLAEYVSTTVSMSLQLGTWWSQNDFDLAVGFAVGVRARHTLLPQPHPRRHQRVAGLTPGRLICYNLNAAIDILLG